jgi:hypothetical protein
MFREMNAANIPSEGYTSGSNDRDDSRLVVRVLVAVLHGVDDERSSRRPIVYTYY